MSTYEKLVNLISEQQKGHENEPLFMVGEQLKDIARDNDEATQILLDDLSVAGMSISDAEKEIKKYADKNRGTAKSFCVSPAVAEKILIDFYKIPEVNAPQTEQNSTGYIDLSSIL
jgi:hypothetical protein